MKKPSFGNAPKFGHPIDGIFHEGAENIDSMRKKGMRPTKPRKMRGF
jgi:hypothetical protein